MSRNKNLFNLISKLQNKSEKDDKKTTRKF